MPQVKPTPAAESVLGLDGEDTLSERGSVGSKPGPGSPDDGGEETSSSSSSAGSKRKRDSLSCDRVQLDEPEVTRSISSDSTWSADSHPPSKSRKKNGHSEHSVSSGAFISPPRGVLRKRNKHSEPSVSSGALINRPRGVLRKRNVHPEPSISSGALIGLPRGVLRLRKLPQNVTIEGGTGDFNVLQSNGISKPPHFVRRKNKRIPHTLKENRVAGDDPVSCSKTENGICDQESTEDDLSVETQSHLSGEPSKPVHVDEESLGDDDVNLEENAARMLCSLSDICADPPRKRTNSPDRSSKAYFRHSNRFKDPYNKVKDAAHPARLLRKRDDKVTFRKRRPRRHFYEVSPHDIDPLGIVKERIRVFWPLDETWYFGLVKEYNPVTRLHHVKYDDKDEEWINIQTERIKLLLLPGEGRKISNRNKPKKKYKVNYEGDKKENMDGNSPRSSESEPIISWLARSDQARPATSSNINKPDQCHSNIVPISSNSLDVERGKLCSNDAIPGSVPSNGGIEVHNDGTTFEDRRFRFVYSRKRFPRTRNGFLNISEHDSNPKSIENSADVLGSVIGREASTETDAPVKYVMLLLSRPLKSVYKLRSEAFSDWVPDTLFHPQHGSLVALWPAVCLDILLVDDALGLKHLLLETSLRSAVSLFCLLAGSFNQYSEQSTLKETKTPCTSVRFQISGLHGRNQVVFVLFSFFGIGKSQWKNLQAKLRYHSLKKELSKVNCTYANIKHLTNGTDRGVSTSTNLFSKCLSLDVRGPQFRSESSYPDVDPVIFCLDGQNEFAKRHMDVVAAPLLLLCHHLKLLIESNLTSNGLAHEAAPVSGVSSLNASSSTDWPVDMGTVGFISHSNYSSRKQDMADCSVSLDCNDSNNGDINGACNKFPDQNGSYVPDDKPCSSDLNGICSPQKSKHPSIDIPQDKTSDSPDELLVKDGKATEPVSNLVQELNERPIGSATPTAPRTSYHRNRFTSLSRTFGDGSKLWPEETMSTGFAGGSKKPRSQVSYSVSPKSDELGLKHKGHFRKTHSSIKINGAKRLPDNTRSGESSPESLACVANVLVTVGDRGWREYDTQITIDTDGQSDRRICVRLAEGTKYAHKVCQVLQPGATNRYTHAMLWKGGPEWYLEFPDRSQWLIFKQMHDECYSHNIRAACVKNIPIPGVRLVDGHDDNVVASFVRPQGYLCHMGPDVKIALDESRVIYDMDSDDEDWISRWKKNQQSKISTVCELTDDMFERVVDKFEKLAHTHNCNELTLDQMKELDMDNVPLDIIELIHDYWHDKRQTKGMPLVRHFQSALWKIYEQQLQEWESAVDRIQGSSNGYQGKRLPPKPALFAFCLKPRGLQLQIPSKGPKQRSHKKLMYSGCHSFSREQDGFYRQVSGRKYSEYVGDGRTCESYDGGSLHSPTGHSPRFSMRTDSPRAFDAAERGSTPRFIRTNSVKRNASVAFSEDNQQSPSFRNQKIKRGAPDHWKTAMHEYQHSKHLLPGTAQGQRVEVEELKLRDATSAVQHAATMARLKRERAHCLMHKADLAVHRASVAVMIADAIRASSSSRDPRDEER